MTLEVSNRRNDIHEALSYIGSVFRHQSATVDAALLNDLEAAFSGGAILLKRFFAVDDNDTRLFDQIIGELEIHEGVGLTAWSQHLKHENPTFSPTFNAMIAALSDWFNYDVFATRLNVYRDGTDWKPFHHDSHAYGANGEKEDFTAGISLGAARDLVFAHVKSSGGKDGTALGHSFTFPQRNGDVFAFNGEVNAAFQHGVPKHPRGTTHGPRISIIAWGKRRLPLINRNGGAGTEPLPPPPVVPAFAATPGSEGPAAAAVLDTSAGTGSMVSEMAALRAAAADCSTARAPAPSARGRRGRGRLQGRF